VFTALGLLFSTQIYLDSLYARAPVKAAQALSLALAGWYGWVLFLPAVIWVARRVRLARPLRAGPLAIHLIASLFFTFAKLAATSALLGRAGFGPREVTSTINIPLNYITYWIIVAAAWTLDLRRQQQAERVRLSALEASLATARLDALALQLQPHFLFNTLNSIAELMHENVDAAEQMVARLSTLLRTSLDSSLGHEVSLERELSFLDQYVGIERVRFEERLRVDLRIGDGARAALVPRLLLQPLVENAVRHAVAPRRDGGRITIEAERQGPRLTIRIGDDGPGLGRSQELPSANGGIGLANARARLSALYGDDQTLRLQAGTEGGLSVIIDLPFRAASAAGRAS